MKQKIVVNYFINIALIISFLGTAITGILKFPKIMQLTTLHQHIKTYKTITFIHDWSGVLMSLLVLAHIILHWRWMVVMSKKILGKNK